MCVWQCYINWNEAEERLLFTFISNNYSSMNNIYAYRVTSEPANTVKQAMFASFSRLGCRVMNGFGKIANE